MPTFLFGQVNKSISCWLIALGSIACSTQTLQEKKNPYWFLITGPLSFIRPPLIRHFR